MCDVLNKLCYRHFVHLQVLFVDPADRFCGELLKLAEAFYVHNAPVRSALFCTVTFSSSTLSTVLLSVVKLFVT